jgi:hypothetical protein
MTSPEEKKWYIYVVDHHEGPFSISELQDKMNLGLVTETSFVWADGMQDWEPVTEVEDLSSIFKNSALVAVQNNYKSEEESPAIFAPDISENVLETKQIEDQPIVFNPPDNLDDPSRQLSPISLEEVPGSSSIEAQPLMELQPLNSLAPDPGERSGLRFPPLEEIQSEGSFTRERTNGSNITKRT